MAVPLLNQQETQEQYLSVKNSYKFGDFSEKRMYNTAVLDGIMQSIQPE
jgi:hypothetical protein